MSCPSWSRSPVPSDTRPRRGRVGRGPRTATAGLRGSHLSGVRVVRQRRRMARPAAQHGLDGGRHDPGRGGYRAAGECRHPGRGDLRRRSARRGHRGRRGTRGPARGGHHRLRHRRRDAARARVAGPARGRGARGRRAGPGAGDGRAAGRTPVELARDQTWFLAIFAVKVGLGLVAFSIKPWLGVAFFAAYGVYFWRELRGGGPASVAELAPLRLQPRRAVPSRTAVLVQTLGCLALIFVASQLFVGQLEWAGPVLGLPPAVVALLLAPIATELPETMNALIWVRQGKTQLALGNISGSMMIQATIPSGLGLLFTPWRFDTPLLLAAVTTAAAVLYLLVLLRTKRLTPGRLVVVAGFYSAFAIALALI